MTGAEGEAAVFDAFYSHRNVGLYYTRPQLCPKCEHVVIIVNMGHFNSNHSVVSTLTKQPITPPFPFHSMKPEYVPKCDHNQIQTISLSHAGCDL